MNEDQKCEKCNYRSKKNREKFKTILCNICYTFSPNDEKTFKNYIEEKLDGKFLETFRKYSNSLLEKQKKGMVEKAYQGKIMSRGAFGYKIENKRLMPAENFREVEDLFMEFLNHDMSLTKLAQKHNLSINGVKKILTNFTYIGKIKFDKQIYNGNHQAIISPTLFNHVQDKLERLGIKRN